MTTIATDGYTMATDRQMTQSWVAVGHKDKVFRNHEGKIFACTGDSTDCEIFRLWMNDERPDAGKELGDDFSALVLTAPGKVFFYDKKLVPIAYDVPAALGSGGDIALGAMLHGASPEEAVEIAISRDIGSGGGVDWLAL